MRLKNKYADRARFYQSMLIVIIKANASYRLSFRAFL